MTANTEIMARATEMATANPPHVSFAKLGELLENMFFGVFKIIGWLIGRAWFHGTRVLYVVGLAFADGYRNGVKAPPEVPPQLTQPAQPGMPPLLDDNRTISAYETPFGIPFGPNVQASHD
jgi:hypothetical protein